MNKSKEAEVPCIMKQPFVKQTVWLKSYLSALEEIETVCPSDEKELWQQIEDLITFGGLDMPDANPAISASFYVKIDKHDPRQQIMLVNGVGTLLFIDGPHGREKVMVTEFVTVGDKPRFMLVKAKHV